MFRETPEVNSMLIRQYAQGFSVFGPMDFTRPRPQNAIFFIMRVINLMPVELRRLFTFNYVHRRTCDDNHVVTTVKGL